MKVKHVIAIDLDGTLIDSCLRIAQSLTDAFLKEGWKVQVKSQSIGPDLKALVEELSQSVVDVSQHSEPRRWSAEDQVKVLDHFKQDYDENCHEVPLFKGVKESLERLQSMDGVCLALATYKRQKPTERIVSHHGLDQFFSKEHRFSAETFPQAQKKSSALLALKEKYPGALVTMVGDSDADYQAALEAQADQFIFFKTHDRQMVRRPELESPGMRWEIIEDWSECGVLLNPRILKGSMK